MAANQLRNVILLTSVLLLAASNVAAQTPAAPKRSPVVSKDKTLYRWVDENGQVHYGDRVPASDAKRGREALNQQGTVTKVVPRELNGAELEQAQARLAAQQAAAEARQQRLIYDRYLLQSFASVADLQAVREERLLALEGRISLTQAAVLDNEKTLADLRERAGAKTVAPQLQKQIDSFESSLIDNLQALRKLRDERAATEIKYANDIERFKGLRAGTIAQGE